MHERDFRQLYEDHYAHVLNYLRRDLPEESARDVTAETFLTAWRKLSEPPDHPVAWLLTVARHLRANAHRAQARDLRSADALTHPAPRTPRLSPATRGRRPTVTAGGDPEADQDTGCSISAALARLSPADREVLLLVASHDLDNHGLAQVLGCTTGAARVRLHRARHRLLRRLDPSEPSSPASATAPPRHSRWSAPSPSDPADPADPSSPTGPFSSSTTEASHGA